MKRYLVFAGNAYYPEGGWDDLVFQSDSKRECQDFLNDSHYDWWHVIDTLIPTKIWEQR
jgi:hypothetical protein